MNIKKWPLIVLAFFALFLSVIYFVNSNHVKEVLLFKENDFNSVNSTESWRHFRKELNLSQENVRIQNFQLILDKNNKIYSVKFDLADKKDTGKITVYHYSNCFSCDTKEENRVNISKNSVREWKQYDKMMRAESFFKSLHVLKQQGFFNTNKFNYELIVSTGWIERIGLEGEYFLLENKTIHKIDHTKPRKGLSLQVIGNNLPHSFSTDVETTKSIFLPDYYQ
ncbi:hypothetical protein [Peribacillus kribbensis]|uniref:hypothetical protein n=1 Tax=Peribacillus kribbensis TaxID=356658 RepID=UPI00138AAE67|nr:hypothetical protein [Peribacillus kribbensis]